MGLSDEELERIITEAAPELMRALSDDDFSFEFECRPVGLMEARLRRVAGRDSMPCEWSALFRFMLWAARADERRAEDRRYYASFLWPEVDPWD